QLAERASATAFFPSDNHLAHGGDAIALEEHVLGAAETNSFGAEAARDAGIAWSVGVGADAQLAHFVSPGEQLRVGLIERCLRRRQRAIRHPDYFARHR